MNKNHRMLYWTLQYENYENVGLLDTAAVQSALSEKELRWILTAHPEALLEALLSPTFKIQITKGKVLLAEKQVSLRLRIAGKVFEETFMVSHEK